MTNIYERKRQEQRDNVIGGCIAVIVAIVLAALLLQFAWNVGLVGMLAAAGLGNISGISYWTALGGLALIVFIRSLFIGIRVGD